MAKAPTPASPDRSRSTSRSRPSCPDGIRITCARENKTYEPEFW